MEKPAKDSRNGEHPLEQAGYLLLKASSVHGGGQIITRSDSSGLKKRIPLWCNDTHTLTLTHTHMYIQNFWQ